MIFHKHKWIEYGKQLCKKEYVGLLGESFEIVTIITFKCVKCNKYKQQEVIGNITKTQDGEI